MCLFELASDLPVGMVADNCLLDMHSVVKKTPFLSSIVNAKFGLRICLSWHQTFHSAWWQTIVGVQSTACSPNSRKCKGLPRVPTGVKN